jgi:hypothetical protein
VLKIIENIKKDREMSYCEDGDPYPSKIDGNKGFILALLPAPGVSRAGA